MGVADELPPTQGNTPVTVTSGWHETEPAVCIKSRIILPLSAAVSSYSLVEGSAGTRGSMFMMRFLWLKELKLRL